MKSDYEYDIEIVQWRRDEYKDYQERLCEEERQVKIEEEEKEMLEEKYGETVKSDDCVKCPKCGCLIENMWEYNMCNGDEIEEECPCCGAILEILCDVVTCYRATVIKE